MPLDERRLATLDLETDPFDEGRPVKPFVAGFYDGVFEPQIFWGADCIDQLFRFLKRYNVPLLVYAHNGGRFDYLFMQEYWNQTPFIIKNRVVRWFWGKHQFRDSWPIIPEKLGHFGGKLPMNYDIMKVENRDIPENRALIEEYLGVDCTDLHGLVQQFTESYGREGLTVAGIAGRRMEKLYPIERLTPAGDGNFRENYYFGGRVEMRGRAGTRRPKSPSGKFYLYDYNGLYGYVMCAFQHPTGLIWSQRGTPRREPEITPNTFFVQLEGIARGCLPFRNTDGSIDYPNDGAKRVYHCSVHEYRMAMKLGLIGKHRIQSALECRQHTDFSDYIMPEYDARRAAQRRKDKTADTFHKLMINSAYGRQAFDPAGKFQTLFVADGKWHKADIEKGWQGWELFLDARGIGRFYRRPLMRPENLRRHHYRNVATAASITGAGRAMMMELIHACGDGFHYCDTDAAISDGKPKLPRNRFGKGLGRLKLEKTGSYFSVAAKKLYALYDRDAEGRICEGGKIASKGAKLDTERVIAVAEGVPQAGYYVQPAPMFSIDGKQWRLARNLTRTADDLFDEIQGWGEEPDEEDDDDD